MIKTLQRALALLTLALLATPAFSAVAFVRSWKNETPANPLVISISPSPAANDYLIGIWATDGGGDTFAPASPFTMVDVRTSTADAQTSGTAAGKATGSETTNSTGFSPNGAAGIIGSFSGVDTTTPNDATPVSGGSSTAGTTAVLSITTTTANAMIVMAVGWDTQGTTSPTTVASDNAGGLSWTWVPFNASGNFHHGGFAYAIKPTAGSVQVTLTISGINAGWGGSLFALKAAGGGGGGATAVPVFHHHYRDLKRR